MNLKTLVLGVALVVSSLAISQSTFSLQSDAPVWSDLKDQYSYPASDFSEYYVSFDVSELNGILKLRVELVKTVEGKSYILYTNKFSTQELNQNYKTGNTIKISFGNLEIGDYSVSIQPELAGKKYGNKITKTTAP